MPYKKRKRSSNEKDNGAPHYPPRTSFILETCVYGLMLLTPLALGTVHIWTTLGMLVLSVVAFFSLLLQLFLSA